MTEPRASLGPAVPPPAPWSLLTRLAWIATAAVLVSLLFGGVAMYWAASMEDDRMQEARLEQLGTTIRMLVDRHLTDLRADAAPVVPEAALQPASALLYRYQVWSRDGALLMRSHEAPVARPMSDLSHLGFSTATIDGEDYRVLSLATEAGDLVIEVAENNNDAWREVGLATFYYAAFLLVPFGIVLAATWLLLRRALHSINSLAARLESRNPLESTPIPVESPPREIVPILDAMDQLFGRMHQALSVERSFTSRAAHEMRTPLASLRMQAQVLTRAGLSEEPLQMVSTLIQGVDRASHMLDQLLDMARVETLALSGDVPMELVALNELLSEVMVDLAPLLRTKRQVLNTVVGPESCWCHAFGLRVLVRNLLANAVLYTPVAGRIEMHAQVDETGVTLVFDDSGPGIAAADRERAFERFNRLGRTQANGVGVGLSIVLSIVGMHRGKIQLDDSPLGGLRATVWLPQPAPSAATTSTR